MVSSARPSRNSPASTRHAGDRDLDQIAAIYNSAMNERKSTFDTLHVTASAFEPLIERQPGRCSLIVAEIGDRIVGWTSVLPRSERWAYRNCAHGALYVDRRDRHRGIGTMLKLAQVQSAKELGYTTLIAEILSTNPVAVHLNIASGYRHVGILRGAGFIDGRDVDLIIMQLDIPEAPLIERRVRFAIFTDEIENTIRLYRDALGLDMRPLSNAILMFPLGEAELEVCHRDQAYDLVGALTPDVVTRGVVLTIRYDTQSQIDRASHAAQLAGAILVDQRTGWCQLTDFNGVTWCLSRD